MLPLVVAVAGALVGCGSRQQAPRSAAPPSAFHPVVKSELGTVAILGDSTHPRPRGGARTDVGFGTLVVADIGPSDAMSMTLVSLDKQPTCVAHVTRRVAAWIESTAGDPGPVFEGRLLAGCAEQQGERWLVAVDGSHPDARRIEETVAYDPYRWEYFSSEPKLVLSPKPDHADELDVGGCNGRGEATKVFVGGHRLADRGLDGEPFGAEVGDARYLLIRGQEALQVARLTGDGLVDAPAQAFPSAYDCL